MNHIGLSYFDVTYPEREDVIRLSPPMVGSFMEYCRSVKPVDDFAAPRFFNRVALSPWFDNIVIVDNLAEIKQFRYRYYGAKIAATNGFDMTGRYVSDFDSEVGRTVERLYRQCITERVLIRFDHPRVHAQIDCEWHRLLCPVRDGDATYVVALAAPVNIRAP